MSGARHGRGGAPGTRFVEARPRRWAPGTLLRVSLRDNGIELGVTPDGSRLHHPLLLPNQPTRVGIVGLADLTQVLALRLLDASCGLTVLTGEPDRWRELLGRVQGATFEVVSQVSQWPPDGSTAPWALIADSDQPPPPGFGRSPWSAVVHAPNQMPQGSAWWQSAQYLITGPEQAPSVLNLRPRLAQDVVAGLQPGQLISVEPNTATVFTPSLTSTEERFLRGADVGPGGR
ncbi:hypothetical protein [uncultured Jatrophihabitans sp.]|uniref:hypothetical protein n=1 Tax=uncultured Jatrophihabitans sp. TaxID=1610747 RepID=UPI0035CB6E97